MAAAVWVFTWHPAKNGVLRFVCKYDGAVLHRSFLVTPTGFEVSPGVVEGNVARLLRSLKRSMQGPARPARDENPYAGRQTWGF